MSKKLTKKIDERKKTRVVDPKVNLYNISWRNSSRLVESWPAFPADPARAVDVMATFSKAASSNSI